MLPPNASAILDSWLSAEFEARNRTLSNQFRQKQNEMTTKGLGRSGALISAVVGLAEYELTVRAEITFKQFLRAANDWSVPIDDSFRAYGRTEIDKRIRLILVPELRQRVSSLSGLKTLEAPLEGALQNIDIAGERAVRKYHAELDSLIARNKKPHQQSDATHGNTFQVSGSVGVIQIGSGNSATAYQQIEQSTVTGLNDVLGALLPEIEKLSESALSIPKKDLVEVIVASRSELQKKQPNWTLAGSLLLGVATTIQTVAALQPSYQALKSLLALIGMSIP